MKIGIAALGLLLAAPSLAQQSATHTLTESVFTAASGRAEGVRGRSRRPGAPS